MRTRGFSGLALVAAFIGGAIGPLAHLALVPHIRCAQHGELIHGTAVATVAAPPASETPTATTAPVRETEEHDHCGVTAEQRATTATATPRFVITAPLALASIGVGHEARLAVELLQLAPKASPPARA